MENQFGEVELLRRKMKRRLASGRYEHSLSVSFTCMNLAMRYGYDMDRAEIAGLLHDCGKCFPEDIIYKKCLKHGIEVTPEEAKAKAVLHAKYGAWLAKNKYGVNDPEILSAIACHTTGKPQMTTLDKILYIADYIEPRRNKAQNLPTIRAMAFEDLDRTMFAILNGTLSYLEKKGSAIDSMTLQAHQYFRELLKGE